MSIADLIEDSQREFLKVCRQHKVDKLFAFGSSITSKFRKHSDLDLQVIIDCKDPLERGELMISLWDQLEKLFNRRIDLVTPDSVKNPYLKNEIDSTKRLIYDRKRKEISL